MGQISMSFPGEHGLLSLPPPLAAPLYQKRNNAPQRWQYFLTTCINLDMPFCLCRYMAWKKIAMQAIAHSVFIISLKSPILRRSVEASHCVASDMQHCLVIACNCSGWTTDRAGLTSAPVIRLSGYCKFNRSKYDLLHRSCQANCISKSVMYADPSAAATGAA